MWTLGFPLTLGSSREKNHSKFLKAGEQAFSVTVRHHTLCPFCLALPTPGRGRGLQVRQLLKDYWGTVGELGELPCHLACFYPRLMTEMTPFLLFFPQARCRLLILKLSLGEHTLAVQTLQNNNKQELFFACAYFDKTLEDEIKKTRGITPICNSFRGPSVCQFPSPSAVAWATP